MSTALSLLLALSFSCGGSATAQTGAEFGLNQADLVMPRDNADVYLPPVMPLDLRPAAGSPEYLFQLYGEDFDRHAGWHMDLLSLYRHGGATGRRPPVKEAVASLKALSFLGSGSSPLVKSQDALFWLPRTIIDVMKYGRDAEVRGTAALALGVVLAGKDPSYAKEGADALASTVLYEDEEFFVRRFAIMALAGARQPYAVGRLALCGKQLGASHDFIGRGKFRYAEDDESSWALESSIIRGLEEALGFRETKDPALSWLKYFADLTRRTCGNYTVIKLPEDDAIDETLMVNARLVLAEKGYIYRNTTDICLLPIVNDGDYCELRKKASSLYWAIHGDVLHQSGTYVPGNADCTELITNKIMLNLAEVYVTGLGTGLLVKGTIRGCAKGIMLLSSAKRAEKIANYARMIELGYDRADAIKNYYDYFEAARQGAR